MKVIADMGHGKLMCEVSVSELIRLRGCASSYDQEWRKEYAMVGAEVDLTLGFNTMDSLRNLGSNEINSVGKALVHLQDKFDVIKAAQEKLMLFDTLKEAGKSNT